MDEVEHKIITRGGTDVDTSSRMDQTTTTTTPTVEMSLDALSQAVGRASDDLRAVRATLCLARADIGSRNTSISRDVSRHAELVIDHLREVDESLKEVVNDLLRRD